MTIRLRIEEEGKEPRSLEFSKPVISIGRSADNDLAIADARSSRRHCTLTRTPQGVVLEDQGSSNGTVCRGEAVARTLLEPGEEFRIGSTVFRYDPAEPSAAFAPPPDPASGDAVSATRTTVVQEPVAAAEPPPAPRPEPAHRPAAAARGTDGARGGGAAVGRLELLRGGLKERSIALAKLPFVIGRGSDCDLRLRDRRVSNRHAEIALKDGVLIVVDLESRNGTAVDDRRVRKAAVLGAGTRLLIGDHLFAVHIDDPAVAAAAAARSGKRSGGGGAGPEPSQDSLEIRIDAAALAGAESWQQPVSVAALLVIAGLVAYFAIDIASRLLMPPRIDPPAEGNLLANWSFEDPVLEGAPAGTVPGWKLVAAPGGDASGEMALTRDDAQEPGFFALQVTARAPRDGDASGSISLVRQSEQLDAIDRKFLLEGLVVNRSAFAAGFLVEWTREQAGREVVVGRSFSAAARGAGAVVEVSQVLRAPLEATQGRLSCLVLGPGSAAFDQVSVARVGDGGAGAAAAEAEDGRSEHVFQARTGDELLALTLRDGGSFHVIRETRELIADLWAALEPARDPRALGPRLAEARFESSEGGRLTALAEIPDFSQRDWVPLVTTADVSSAGFSLRWRVDAQEPGPRALAVYARFRDPSLPVVGHGERSSARMEVRGAAGGPFAEVVLGEGSQRASLEFSPPVVIASSPDPDLTGQWLLTFQPGAPASDLSVALSAGSRREAQAARQAVADAEQSFESGRPAQAIEVLQELRERYPYQEAVIRRAEELLREWQGEAERVERDLDAVLAAYRARPSEVIYESLVSRARELRERFAGTKVVAKVESVIRELDTLRNRFTGARREEEGAKLLEAAREAMGAERLGLAQVYLESLLQRVPEGSRLRDDARTALMAVEKRRKSASDILLGR